MISLNENDHVRVIIIIHYLIKDEFSYYDDYRSLTYLLTINNNDKEQYISAVMSNIDVKSNWYTENVIRGVYFKYRIERDNKEIKSSLITSSDKTQPKLKFTFENYNLPLPNTSNFNDFGSIVQVSENVFYTSNKDHSITIEVHDKYNEITITKTYNGIAQNINVIDFPTDNPQTFTRVFDNSAEHHFILKMVN